MLNREQDELECACAQKKALSYLQAGLPSPLIVRASRITSVIHTNVNSSVSLFHSDQLKTPRIHLFSETKT